MYSTCSFALNKSGVKNITYEVTSKFEISEVMMDWMCVLNERQDAHTKTERILLQSIDT
jgi:hypothetical protein